MKPAGNFLGTVVGLSVVAGLLFAAYLLLKYVAQVFASVQPQVETLAAIASAAALLGAAIVADGLRSLGARALQTAAFARKAATYEAWLSHCAGCLPDAGLVEIVQTLALVGTRKAMAAYLKYLCVRKDLGPVELGRDDLSDLLSGRKP